MGMARNAHRLTLPSTMLGTENLDKPSTQHRDLNKGRSLISYVVWLPSSAYILRKNYASEFSTIQDIQDYKETHILSNLSSSPHYLTSPIALFCFQYKKVITLASSHLTMSV